MSDLGLDLHDLVVQDGGRLVVEPTGIAGTEFGSARAPIPDADLRPPRQVTRQHWRRPQRGFPAPGGGWRRSCWGLPDARRGRGSLTRRRRVPPAGWAWWVTAAVDAQEPRFGASPRHETDQISAEREVPEPYHDPSTSAVARPARKQQNRWLIVECPRLGRCARRHKKAAGRSPPPVLRGVAMVLAVASSGRLATARWPSRIACGRDARQGALVRWRSAGAGGTVLASQGLHAWRPA